MAEPETDRRDVDEAQEALGGLVVAGGDAAGVFQPVEAAFDEVAQPVEGAIHRREQLASFAHGDDRYHVAHFHELLFRDFAPHDMYRLSQPGRQTGARCANQALRLLRELVDDRI